MEAVAKHDFSATQEDELTFPRGATLKVTYYLCLDGTLCMSKYAVKN